MTYTINGVQYWRRNGVCCSWTKEGGRQVITEEVYMSVTGAKKSTAIVKPNVEEVKIDPKSKVEITYKEVNKNDRVVTKKKVVTYGNLEKVISNMKEKDNFVEILATRNI